MSNRIKEIEEAAEALLRKLSEPYTYGTAPDWVKKLPKEARIAWIKAYNAAFKEYNGDEGKSAATASATIEKMGYKKKGDTWIKEGQPDPEHAQPEVNAPASGAGASTNKDKPQNKEGDSEEESESGKDALKELLQDIEDFLAKAGDTIKGKVGSPAIRHFLREVKAKLTGMMKNIKETDLLEKAEETMGKMTQMLEEADPPVGSHEHIHMKLQDALNKHPMFKAPADRQWNTSNIRYTHPDHAIVETPGPDRKLYHVPYMQNLGGEVELGEPKEVEEQTIIKPKGDCPVKESDIKEAVWDTKYINDLPDSSFAYIEPGGEKDSDGKTTPRSKRHLPYKGSDGKVDLPHLRNALARLPQTNITAEAKASAGAKLKAAAKAAKIGEFSESGFEITDLQESKSFEEFQVADFISLSEADVSPDGSKVRLVLIEAGTNEAKKRHYPDETVREAAPLFRGLKQYINHPTKTEEKERPERDIRDWASTITESFPGVSAKTGRAQALAEVSVHDSWLRERLKDPVFRANVGLSINTGGMISQGKVNGQDMDIVEKIVFARKNGPASVDWVTEPGARGRVAGLLESRYEKEKDMKLEELTEKELRETRADLVETIVKTATKDLQEKLQAAEKENAAFKREKALQKQDELVEAAIKKEGIHEAVRNRIREHFKATLVEGDEAALKEAIQVKLKEELEFLSKVTGKGKIKTGANGLPVSVQESIQQDLEHRAGVSDEQLAKEKKETDSK